MERLKEEEMRLAEAANYDEWEAKEEQFHQRVTKERSKLRILAGREKPIDIIAKNLLLLSASRGVVDAAHADAVSLEEEEPELREPHTLFDGLADDALSQLRVR